MIIPAKSLNHHFLCPPTSGDRLKALAFLRSPKLAHDITNNTLQVLDILNIFSSSQITHVTDDFADILNMFLFLSSSRNLLGLECNHFILKLSASGLVLLVFCVGSQGSISVISSELVELLLMVL